MNAKDHELYGLRKPRSTCIARTLSKSLKKTNFRNICCRCPVREWALWRSAILRGAGFPSTDVLKLTAPESAAAADRLIAAELEARQLQQNGRRGSAQTSERNVRRAS